MDHLWFIVGAYGVGLLVPLGFTLAAWVRLRRATVRLGTLDSRFLRARSGGTGS